MEREKELKENYIIHLHTVIFIKKNIITIILEQLFLTSEAVKSIAEGISIRIKNRH